MARTKKTARPVLGGLITRYGSAGIDNENNGNNNRGVNIGSINGRRNVNGSANGGRNVNGNANGGRNGNRNRIANGGRNANGYANNSEMSVCPIATTGLGQCRLVKSKTGPRKCEIVEPSNEWKAFHKDKKIKPVYADAVKSLNFLPGLPFPKTLAAKERLCAYTRARQRLEKGVIKPEWAGVEAKMRGGIRDEDIRPGYELRFSEEVTNPEALRGIEKLRAKRLAAAGGARAPRVAPPGKKNTRTKKPTKRPPGVVIRSPPRYNPPGVVIRSPPRYNSSPSSSNSSGYRSPRPASPSSNSENDGSILPDILDFVGNSSSSARKRVYEMRVTFPRKRDASPDTHVVMYCGSNGRLYVDRGAVPRRMTKSRLALESMVISALRGTCPSIQRAASGFYGNA